MTAPALLILVLALGAVAEPPDLLPKPTAPILTRCTEGSADYETARDPLGVVRGRVEALTDTSDPAPAVAALRSLLRQRCLAMAVEVGSLPEPKHALALKTWWERGGESWLWSYLKMPELGALPNLRPNVVLPPGMRSVLFRETTRDKQIAPLLCSQADAACGVETEGWMARARAVVEIEDLERQREDERARIRMDAAMHHQPDPPDDQPIEIDAGVICGRQAPKIYTKWRHCLADHQAPIQAMPLGRTRAPKDGWLILVGRRGHYEFSDEARAYDLATGAAFVSTSSSALVVQPGGEVNFDKTDAARKPHLSAGRLASIDNLREAVWMLMLRTHAEKIAIHSKSYPLPEGMTVEYAPNDSESPDYVMGPGGWSTAWTTLDWRWLAPDGTLRAEGEVTWPASDDRAEAHAAALSVFPEPGFGEGCPPATPPQSASPWRARVNRRDGPAPAQYHRLIDGLWRGIVDFTPAGSCR